MMGVGRGGGSFKILQAFEEFRARKRGLVGKAGTGCLSHNKEDVEVTKCRKYDNCGWLKVVVLLARGWGGGAPAGALQSEIYVTRWGAGGGDVRVIGPWHDTGKT